MVKQLEQHAQHCIEYFKPKVIAQKPKQQKKRKPKKKQIKLDDEDDAFLDSIIAANKIEIKQYKATEVQLEQRASMENQRIVDEVIFWYKEKWSLVETFEKKLKQIDVDPKLKNDRDAINNLLSIDKTNF